MKKRKILLNTLVASTILLGGVILTSCDSETVLAVDEEDIKVSLTINDENGGSINFYKTGSAIDLTSDEDIATLEVGDSISFIIRVNNGYSFESILLNGSNLSTTISAAGNRTGSFTISSGDNDLVLTFQSLETRLSDFSFTYDDTNLEATVISYTCSTSIAPSPVMIPETVENEGKTYKVTGVAMNAFSNYGAEISSIYIPKYIRDLDEQAFYMPITTLTSFVVDEENEYYTSYEGILYDSNYETVIAVPNGLSSVSLYEGVKELGDYALANSAIESFVIPSSLTSIGNYCFYNSKLETISGGENLVSIGQWAFYYTNIASFTFGSALETIGEYAFGETELTSIDLSNTKLTELKDGAFYHTDNLGSITFNNNIVSIGYEAFWNTGLSTVTLPTELITLGSNAFSQAWSLSTINFNDKLENIGSYCFYQNYNLTSMNLPESIKVIDEGAFSAIDAVGNSSTNFTIGSSNDNGYYKVEDGVLYEYDEYNGSTFTLHTYTRGKQSSEYEILENVTVIKTYAFAYVFKLAKLTLPKSLTKIEANAFYGLFTNSTDVTELELYYSGDLSEFEEIELEEGWNTGLIAKENVVNCNDGTYTLPVDDEEEE